MRTSSGTQKLKYDGQKGRVEKVLSKKVRVKLEVSGEVKDFASDKVVPWVDEVLAPSAGTKRTASEAGLADKPASASGSDTTALADDIFGKVPK